MRAYDHFVISTFNAKRLLSQRTPHSPARMGAIVVHGAVV